MSDHAHDHPDFLAHHFDTPEQQFEAGKLGMWLFLVTEVLMFGGLFCAYALYRANHPDIFVYAHGFLDWKLGATNTAILLASSFTMALAVRASQLGQKGILILLLVLTLGGGVGFLVIKYIEYTSKFSHSLWPGTQNLYYPQAETTLWQVDGDGELILDAGGNPVPITRDMQLKEIALVEFETLALHHGYVPQPAQAAYDHYTAMGVFETLHHHDEDRGTHEYENAMQMFADAGVAEAAALVDVHGSHGEQGDAPAEENHAGHGEDDTHAHGEDEAHGEAPAHAAAHDDAHGDHAAHDPDYDYNQRLALVPVAGESAAQSNVSPPPFASTSVSSAFAHDADEADAGGLAEALGAPDLSHAKHYKPYHLQPEAVQSRVHLFFQIYYCATGLHALHVLIGMGCITWVLGKSLAGAFTTEYNVPVDIVGLYWHIVDLIWIFLFPLLYLIH